MFDGIAPTYDTLNRVLSRGIDSRGGGAPSPRSARRSPRPARARPVRGHDGSRRAGGAAPAPSVVAADFSPAMLARARQGAGCRSCADALALPFADAEFAGVVCGFGLRNLADTRAGRARGAPRAQPGGVFVTLDSSGRDAPSRARSRRSTRARVAAVGGLVSGDAAPTATSPTDRPLPHARRVERLCREVGFAARAQQDLTLGVASIVVAPG